MTVQLRLGDEARRRQPGRSAFLRSPTNIWEDGLQTGGV